MGTIIEVLIQPVTVKSWIVTVSTVQGRNCYDLDGLACTPSTNNIDACVPTVAPDDFDFPYDVTLDLIACTYDANGDALTFSWSLASQPALGTANFTDTSNTATLSITPPDINGTQQGYFQDDELELQLVVTDVEDTVTRTADMNFCAGWFPDADEDGYGATNAYQANCANTVSTTFVDPSAELQYLRCTRL